MGLDSYLYRREYLSNYTTDLMEASSLEEGDQILFNENIYRITDITLSEEDDDYLLYVVDEEGYRRGPIKVSPLKKLRLVLDNLIEV